MASFQKRDKYYHFRIYYVDNLGKKSFVNLDSEQ